MFCTACGTQQAEGKAHFCANCGARSDTDEALPAGVAGWSWGAFLLNWIWAIGNRTWIGLLALIPYVGLGVAIWLGLKGREMAWKNGKWQNVDHFNLVQRRWSQWGIGISLVFGMISILLSIALLVSWSKDMKRVDASTADTQLATAEIQSPAAEPADMCPAEGAE